MDATQRKQAIQRKRHRQNIDIAKVPAWRKDCCGHGTPKVYLIWAKDTRRFKVGFSNGSLIDRHRALQMCSPLKLSVLGWQAGSKAHEAKVHRALGLYRSHGEWFELPSAVAWGLLAYFGTVPKWFAEVMIQHRADFAAVQNCISDDWKLPAILEKFGGGAHGSPD